MDNTAIILAGGHSSRFGTDKTQAVYEGQTLAERAVRSLEPFCPQILLMSNAVDKFGLEGVTELPDDIPGCGPIGGIATGLKHAEHEICFVYACDMPFFDPELYARMRDMMEDADAVVPMTDGKLQPLCAFVRRDAALTVCEDLIREEIYKMGMLYRRLNTRYYESDDLKAFFNINYSSDLEGLKGETL